MQPGQTGGCLFLSQRIQIEGRLFFFFRAFLKSESREYFFNTEKYFKIP